MEFSYELRTRLIYVQRVFKSTVEWQKEDLEFLGVRPAYANSGNKNSRIGSEMTREPKV